MNFDDYLTEYYGFNTQDGKWKRMSNQGKNLLRDSYKMDIAKLEKGPEPNTQVASSTQSSTEVASLP